MSRVYGCWMVMSGLDWKSFAGFPFRFSLFYFHFLCSVPAFAGKHAFDNLTLLIVAVLPSQSCLAT